MTGEQLVLDAARAIAARQGWNWEVLSEPAQQAYLDDADVVVDVVLDHVRFLLRGRA